jgi:hypothetical protein
MHLTLERIAADDWFFQMRPQLSMHSFQKALHTLLGSAGVNVVFVHRPGAVSQAVAIMAYLVG